MARTEKVRVYWDSCVFIDAIQKTPGRIDDIKEVIKEATDGKIVIVASALARAETFKLSDDNALSADEETLINEFFENDYISLRPVDRYIAERAAEISRTHKLKPYDAIHVATAIKFSCRCLQTFDGCGPKPKKNALLPLNGKIGTPPLKIETPHAVCSDQPPLFE